MAFIHPSESHGVLVELKVGANAKLRYVCGQELNERSWIFGSQRAEVDRLERYVSANPDHHFDVEGELHWWWRPLRDGVYGGERLGVRRLRRRRPFRAAAMHASHASD